MDLSFDIDEQIAAAMAVAMHPPAIVRPYLESHGDFDELVKKTVRDVEETRQEFEAWLRHGTEVRLSMSSIFELYRESVSPLRIDRLRHYALVIEKQAEAAAIELAKREKKYNRQVAEIANVVSKSKVGLLKKPLDDLRDIFYDEIEARLDGALFLRALAGKYDPDQKVVFEAGSVKENAEFFASIGAG